MRKLIFILLLIPQFVFGQVFKNIFAEGETTGTYCGIDTGKVIFYFDFDEIDSDTVYDKSSNNLNAISDTFNIDFQYGGEDAYFYNDVGTGYSADSYIPDDDLLTPSLFALTTIVKPPAANSYLCQKYLEFSIRWYSSYFQIRLNDVGTSTIAWFNTSTITANEKHWLLINYDGSGSVNGLDVYVDGVKNSPASIGGTFTGISNTGNVLFIGAQQPDLSFDGAVYHFAMYNDTLDIEERANWYNDGVKMYYDSICIGTENLNAEVTTYEVSIANTYRRDSDPSISGATSPTSKFYEENTTVYPSSEFINSGLHFKGLYWDALGTSSVPSSFVITQDTTIYAVYDHLITPTYTVSLVNVYLNDATALISGEKVPSSVSGLYEGTWFQPTAYFSGTTNYFTGYYFDQLGNDQITDGFYITGNTTIYAIHDYVEFNVTVQDMYFLDANSAQGYTLSPKTLAFEEGTDVVLADEFSQNSTTYFFGYYSDYNCTTLINSIDSISEDTMVYAKFSYVSPLNHYTVTVNEVYGGDANTDNSGYVLPDVISYIQDSYINIANDFTVFGDNFQGYYWDVAATSPLSSFQITENVMAYAYFYYEEPILDTITMIDTYLNDATTLNSGSTSPDSKSFNRGSTIILSNHFINTGNHFIGFFTDAAGTNPITSKTINGNDTLYAVYDYVTPTPVYYNVTMTESYLNDASPIISGSVLPDQWAFLEGTTVDLSDFENTGAHFQGFYWDAEGTISANDFVITQDTTVYAVYDYTAVTVDIESDNLNHIIGWWDFDETGSTMIDSLNDYDGTYYNSPTRVVVGDDLIYHTFSSASQQYATIPYDVSFIGNTWSVAFWVYFPAGSLTTDYKAVIKGAGGDGNANGWSVVFGDVLAGIDGGAVFRYSDGLTVSFTDSPDEEEWIHYTITKGDYTNTGNLVSIYKNGIQLTQANNTVINYSGSPSSYPFGIGYAANADTADCYLDQVVFADSVLTSSQIAMLSTGVTLQQMKDWEYYGYDFDYFVSNTDTVGPTKLTPSEAESFTFSAGDSIGFAANESFEINITASYSGNSSNPINFGTYGVGEKAKIYGSTEVTGWTVHSGNIYKATFSGTVNQLFEDNVKLKTARYPNTGYVDITSKASASNITANSLPNIDHTGSLVYVRTASWALEARDVTNSTNTNRTLSLSSSIYYNYAMVAGSGIFLTNNLNYLDEAGEWHSDGNTIYAWFPDGSSPSDNTVRASTTDNIIDITNQSYITLENLDILQANEIGIAIDTSSNIIINSVNVEYCETIGIDILNSSSNNCTITNSTVKGSYAFGIRTYGGSHLIQDNTVENIGLFDDIGLTGNNNTSTVINNLNGQLGVGIHLTGAPSGNNVIRYNTFKNLGYNGTWHYWNPDILIEYNFIKNVCLTIDDGAGIYCFGDKYNPGVEDSDGGEIRYNIIDGVIGTLSGKDGTRREGNGIYTDELIRYTNVHHNVIANVTEGGIKQHDNDYVYARNNLLFNCGMGLNPLSSSSTTHMKSNIVLNATSVPPREIGSQGFLGLAKSTDAVKIDSNFYYNLHISLYPKSFREGEDDFSNLTFTQWKSMLAAVSGDVNSTFVGTDLGASQIEVLFYNTTKYDKTFDLSGYNWEDLAGNTVTTLTLPKFTGKILIRQ